MPTGTNRPRRGDLSGIEHITTATLPEIPYRQWALTLPFDLRYVLAWRQAARRRIPGGEIWAARQSQYRTPSTKP